jgi:hypothetical protein|tara:strand:- start:350 stop:460 length:111 start_codon:yes stop_codon:yes gene_type:complete
MTEEITIINNIVGLGFIILMIYGLFTALKSTNNNDY